MVTQDMYSILELSLVMVVFVKKYYLYLRIKIESSIKAISLFEASIDGLFNRCYWIGEKDIKR